MNEQPDPDQLAAQAPLQDTQRARRVALVAQLHLLDRVGDPTLTALTRLAQEITGAASAAVHIFDARHQHRIAATGAELDRRSIGETLCQVAVFGEANVVAEDVTHDPRFSAPLAGGADCEQVRFFAAVPLRAGGDIPVGTICAFDPSARELSARQLQRLEDVATIARAHLELLQVAADLGSAASSDPLTGVANRVIFDDRLARALARRRRNHSNVLLGILDIDDFKALNDGHGHLAGDDALRWVANGLRRALREVDTVGRLGGDEFGIIAEGDAEDFRPMLERARTVSEGFQPQFSVSLGTALARDGDDVESLLRRADAAMYEVKRATKRAASA